MAPAGHRARAPARPRGRRGGRAGACHRHGEPRRRRPRRPAVGRDRDDGPAVDGVLFPNVPRTVPRTDRRRTERPSRPSRGRARQCTVRDRRAVRPGHGGVADAHRRGGAHAALSAVSARAPRVATRRRARPLRERRRRRRARRRRARRRRARARPAVRSRRGEKKKTRSAVGDGARASRIARVRNASGVAERRAAARGVSLRRGGSGDETFRRDGFECARGKRRRRRRRRRSPRRRLGRNPSRSRRRRPRRRRRRRGSLRRDRRVFFAVASAASGAGSPRVRQNEVRGGDAPRARRTSDVRQKKTKTKTVPRPALRAQQQSGDRGAGTVLGDDRDDRASGFSPSVPSARGCRGSARAGVREGRRRRKRKRKRGVRDDDDERGVVARARDAEPRHGLFRTSPVWRPGGPACGECREASRDPRILRVA